MKRIVLWAALLGSTIALSGCSGSAGASAAARPTDNPFVGLWFYMAAPEYGREVAPGWVTIFANGESYQHLPQGGFLHFDANASKQNEYQTPYWGRYEIDGNRITIRRPGVIYPSTFTLLGDNEMLLERSIRAYLVPNVDGLRLDGVWTTVAAQAEYPPYSFPPGQRPLISFSSNGAFRDEGLFLNGYWLSTRNPGMGAYDIKAWTLTLNYSDQAPIELSFSPMGNNDNSRPGSRPKLFFMELHSLYLLR